MVVIKVLVNFIQSVDYDGSMRGFDNELFLNIKKITEQKYH